ELRAVAGALAAAAATLLYGIAGAMAQSRVDVAIITFVAIGPLALALFARAQPALHATALVLTTAATSVVAPSPVALAAPLAGCGIVLLAAPRPRQGAARLARGRLDATTLVGVGAIVLVSSSALVLWLRLARPDLSDLRGLLPRMPWPALVLGGI